MKSAVALPEIHFSRLKLMGRSPAHYQFYEVPDASDLRAGRAVHALVLGGPTVAVYPERRAGKTWEQFKVDHAEDIILSVSEYERSVGMAAAVLGDSVAKLLLKEPGYLYEQELSWTRAGRACAGRADILIPHTAICELKSTKCSKPSWFAAEALRRSYHAQLSWYMDGAAEKYGLIPEAYIIAVESAAPYPVCVFRLSQHVLEMGTRIFTAWWDRLMHCEETNHWPGYTERMLDLDMPDDERWSMFETEEDAA